jgi:hypothetical protein
VEVNENSWVFEFHPDKEKRKEMAELESFVRARVRLNRAYDDAPQQLEIFRKDGDYEVWIAEDYKTVNGCWMPSRVVMESSSSQGRVQVVFELVATTPSAPVQIDIPEGAPVHDWRLLGRAGVARRAGRKPQDRNAVERGAAARHLASNPARIGQRKPTRGTEVGCQLEGNFARHVP